MVLPVARKGSGALVAARVEQPNTGRGLAPVQLALGDGTERGIENRCEVDDRVLHRDVDVLHDDEQRLGPYGWARPGQLRGDVVAVPATRVTSVSYTHLRAHETDSYLVCRLLLEKKKKK